jgi:hypothetical protein
MYIYYQYHYFTFCIFLLSLLLPYVSLVDEDDSTVVLSFDEEETAQTQSVSNRY